MRSTKAKTTSGFSSVPLGQLVDSLIHVLHIGPCHFEVPGLCGSTGLPPLGRGALALVGNAFGPPSPK